MNQQHTTPAAAAAPAIGAPAIRDTYGDPTQRGYIYAVEDAATTPGVSFMIGGNGLEEVKTRLSIVWDDGTTAESLPGHICAPWLDHPAALARAPADSDTIARLLSAARTKRATRLDEMAQDEARRVDTREAFKAELRPLIPELARAVIVAELKADQSDSMSDYWGSTTTRRIILGFSTHARDLFPEMRKAARNHPEVAHLADAAPGAEHRQKYSMGGGYFLKDGGRHSDGWKVSKESFYDRHGNDPAAQIQPGEISLTPPAKQKAPTSTATATAPATVSGGVTIEARTHTKKGFQMWIVCLADRVERAEYDAFLTTAKTGGGWYSRKYGDSPAGFAFKDQNAAQAFADGIGGATAPEPGQTAPTGRESTPTAPTPPAPNEATACKLETLADGMQSAIDSAFADRRTNTPKQRRQKAGAVQEGQGIERAQSGLRSLALMHRAGGVPAILADVKTKKAALDLARESFDHSESGYYDAGRGRNRPALDTDKARAFWDIAGPRSADDIARDKIAAVEMALKNTSIPGFFATPAAIVARMLDGADLAPGQSVLEPSAGAGAIADGVREAEPAARLTCLEINPRLCELLTLKGHAPALRDFTETTPLGVFDRVVMNPPFERGQDVDHVRLAFDCLKPGGRLVAIMAPAYQYNSTRKFSDFRAWLAPLDHWVEQIDAGAFKESGTGVATVLLTIQKAESV
jgi:predicted RNA methylase